MYDYLFGIVAVVLKIFNKEGDIPPKIWYKLESYDYKLVAPIGATVLTLFALIILIRSLVRLISGHAKSRGIFCGIMLFLGYVALLVGLALNSAFAAAEGDSITFNAFLDEAKNLFVDAQIGLYIITGLVVAITVVGCFSPKTYHKEKKAKAKKNK